MPFRERSLKANIGEDMELQVQFLKIMACIEEPDQTGINNCVQMRWVSRRVLVKVKAERSQMRSL